MHNENALTHNWLIRQKKQTIHIAIATLLGSFVHLECKGKRVTSFLFFFLYIIFGFFFSLYRNNNPVCQVFCTRWTFRFLRPFCIVRPPLPRHLLLTISISFIFFQWPISISAVVCYSLEYVGVCYFFNCLLVSLTWKHCADRSI